MIKNKYFLIVECKKNGAQLVEIDDDRKKIQALMENDKHKYSFGLQVVYGKDEIKGTLFSKNGQAIEQEEIISNYQPARSDAD